MRQDKKVGAIGTSWASVISGVKKSMLRLSYSSIYIQILSTLVFVPWKSGRR